MRNVLAAIAIVLTAALLFAQGDESKDNDSADSLSCFHEFCEYELFGEKSFANVEFEDDKVLEIRITGERVENASIIFPVRYDEPLQGLVYIGRTHVGAICYLKRLKDDLIQIDGTISFTVFKPDGYTRLRENVSTTRQKLKEYVVSGILAGRRDEDPAYDPDSLSNEFVAEEYHWIVRAVVRDRYGPVESG